MKKFISRNIPDMIKIWNSKLFKTMRLTVFISLIGIFQSYAVETYAQMTRLTLEAKNTTVKDVLNQIEEQSEFYFLYNSKLVDVYRKVNLDVKDKKISDILEMVFEGTNTTYKVVDRQIVLTTEEMGSSFEAQQQKSVSGKVTDSTGASLPGVSVVVKETTKGVITDMNGKYTISNVPENATLQFSFVGMKTQEIVVGNRSTINAMLTEETVGIDEVVAIGYGTQRKVTLTGSVAKISSSEILKIPTTNVTNALAGLLPGVIAQNISGEPGKDNYQILIRGLSTTGNNSPLVVVDGVQDVSGWERINGNDIESVSVLKDASAAIYGARAANGVILITTKRGITGKPTISFTFNQGISQPTRLPKLASSNQLAQYINQLDVEAGGNPRYSASDLQKFQDGTDPNFPNVNWYKESLRKNVPKSQHNLNVRGGTENMKYSVSGSFSDENGIFKNTSLKYRTYTLRSNLDANVNKWLRLGFDLNSALLDGNYPAGGNDFEGLKVAPFKPVYWSNGLPSNGIEGGRNPIIEASALSGNINNREIKNMVKGSFDIVVPWVKGLGIDGYFAYTNNNTTNKRWKKPWETYSYDRANNEYILQLGGQILQPELSQ
jgi:TonB-dependent starch-binding outer membrane protein SusC